MHYSKNEKAFLMSLKDLSEKEQASFLELFSKETRRTFLAVQRKYKRLTGIYLTDPAIERKKAKTTEVASLHCAEVSKELPAMTVTINKNIQVLEIIEQWNLSYNLGKVLENLLERKDIKTALFFLERENKHYENSL